MAEDSPAVRLLRANPRIFWGNVIRVLISRGWNPPRPDQRIVDDLLAEMERVDVPEYRLLGEVPEDALLTAREKQIVDLVRQGLSNAQVSETLDVAPQTVKFHLANAYRKLGVSSRYELMARLSKAS
jgi:DNA-binding CsgD family transcriptional regulator